MKSAKKCFVRWSPWVIYDHEGVIKLSPKSLGRLEQTLEFAGEIGGRVLDLGCGDGALGQILLSRGQDVLMVDVSLVKLKQVSGSRVLADIRHLPFREGAFQVVFCLEVLEHVYKWKRALAQILKISNRVICSMPYREEPIKNQCPECGCMTPLYGHINVFNEGSLSFLEGKYKVEVGYIKVHKIVDYFFRIWRFLFGILLGKQSIDQPMRTVCVYCGSVFGVNNKKARFIRRLKLILYLMPNWVIYKIEKKEP